MQKKGAPLWRQYLLEVTQNHYQTSPWISTSWVINYTFTEPWPSLISGKNVFEFTQGTLLKVAAMALWIPGMFQGKKNMADLTIISPVSSTFYFLVCWLQFSRKWDDCYLWGFLHIPWKTDQPTALRICKWRDSCIQASRNQLLYHW